MEFDGCVAERLSGRELVEQPPLVDAQEGARLRLARSVIDRPEPTQVVDQTVDHVTSRLRVDDETRTGDGCEQRLSGVGGISDHARADNGIVIAPTLDDAGATALNLAQRIRERTLRPLDNDKRARHRSAASAAACVRLLAPSFCCADR